MELSELKGLGKARLKAFNAAGIFSLRDLLYTLPIGYRDTTFFVPIAELQPGQTAAVCGAFKGSPRLNRFKGMNSVTATLCDETGSITCVWYNQPWLQKQLDGLEEVILYGRMEIKNGRRMLLNPSRETEPGIQPVYKALPGIPGKIMRDILLQALEQTEDCCPETLPHGLRMRWVLCEKNFAIRQAHFPDSQESLRVARRRIAFEQALLYQAGVSLMSQRKEEGYAMTLEDSWQREFWSSLPFAPTNAQTRVLAQTAEDMAKPLPMARLVQGDVGCGKTAIAFGALYLAARAGFQGAMMAPTEILARQHYQSACGMLEPLGIKCGLLLGGMKAKERREALDAIRQGEWQVVIGTHALISDGVEYQNLGLVITDEQHRFGVRQRSALAEKAQKPPHVLVMSATPIPRTLALILYGDLDVSVVDEMPAGRKPVATRLVPESKREGLYGFLRSEMDQGRQAYIVCPLVEESEAMADLKNAQQQYDELAKGPLEGYALGLTWGKQPAEEKERVLADFASGKIQALIATTVIEVGVNVPNATVMVIEDAQRFGLSQLHQLRGRVGRGSRESWCFLLAEPNERLKTLCQTNDGFVIAQKDLDLRGPGEFLGTRQHGMPLMPGVLLDGDVKMLEQVQACLKELRNDHALAGERLQVEANAQKFMSQQANKIALN